MTDAVKEVIDVDASSIINEESKNNSVNTAKAASNTAADSTVATSAGAASDKTINIGPESPDNGDGSANDVADVIEERLIDAEYKIWKKNTPYLYDFVMTHSLEWPSLTCQWLPTERKNANGISSGNSSNIASTSVNEYSLILGTHTTEEQNYLMLASCYVPSSGIIEDNAIKDSPTNTSENKESGSQKQEAATSVTTATATTSRSVLPASAYDEEKKEIGGFGFNGVGVASTTASASNVNGKNTTNTNKSHNFQAGKIEVRMKIKHEGEVNRARCMPQNHFIIATRGPSPELYIWDTSKHPSNPANDSVFCPQITCCGHTQEGYGLTWSPHQEGYLISGSEDKTVKLWDVSSSLLKISSNTKNHQIEPIVTFSGHTNVIEDVDWHRKDRNLIGSVSDDRSIRLWDIRLNTNEEKQMKRKDTCVHVVHDAHNDDVNCIAFNPENENIFATGSADKTIALWDMRNLKTHTHVLAGHNDQVYKVDWSPFNESILGSCSADRRVGIWDLSRIGMEQTPEDAEDGPPELLFLHGGHCSKISDFSWNPKDEWTIGSVSEDNVLQVWNMAEEIYCPEDDEGNDDEEMDYEEDASDNKKRKWDNKGGALGEDDLE